MPKTQPSPHFDVRALLLEVHKQDFGLHISTNDPEGFKRIVYQAARAEPVLRIHIYTSRTSKRRFILLKNAVPNTPEEALDGEV